ncbi:tetratricopeptide repeat protein [Flavobacteriaceae bacterium]|jgi:Ca-activated chloride channel family protein|nr:tetratricopeptide repeat protein [Flavobacteriaceae bacterium]
MSMIKGLILFFKVPHKRWFRINNVRLILFLLASFYGSAQDEAQLSMSNNYIFEGNSIVDDDFIEAEKKYRLGVSAKQNNVVGSYNLGNAYYKSELYDEAMLRHLEAIKNSVSKLEKHNAYHNIGNTLMQQKRCQEAVSAYKDALRNNPTDNETRYNLALAQECAKEQGNGDGDGDDEDKDKDKDKDKDDKENSDENKDKEEKNKDKEGEDEDKKEGNDKEDEDGKPKEDTGNQENKDPNKDKGRPKPQPGKISPQQVKNLLEAMNNEEKKVQEKMNASKTKGIKVKSEKDW